LVRERQSLGFEAIRARIAGLLKDTIESLS
jgi:hypothetical protein